jgi:hypothetical protein
MSVSSTFLPGFDQETASTRRSLERVPTDKGEWRPHPESFPLGHLAQLFDRHGAGARAAIAVIRRVDPAAVARRGEPWIRPFRS